jgi:hypothetical protein
MSEKVDVDIYRTRRYELHGGLDRRHYQNIKARAKDITYRRESRAPVEESCGNGSSQSCTHIKMGIGICRRIPGCAVSASIVYPYDAFREPDM